MKRKRISNDDLEFYENNIADAHSVIYDAQITSERTNDETNLGLLRGIAMAANRIRKRNIKRMNREKDESIK